METTYTDIDNVLPESWFDCGVMNEMEILPAYPLHNINNKMVKVNNCFIYRVYLTI